MEDGVQAAVVVHCCQKNSQDAEALNDKVAQAIAKALEIQLEGLTAKAKQVGKSEGSTTIP